MKKILFAAFCVLLCLGENAAAVELVRGGRSCCVIVVAEEAPAQLKDAAEELRHFLFRITGAETPVVTPARLPSGKVPVCVGESALTRKFGYTLPKFGSSGYDVLVEKERIILDGPVFRNEVKRSLASHPAIHVQNLYRTLARTGPRREEFADFGPMHAVSAFLELLGVRFYAPGEEGIFVPEKKDLTLEERRITREAAFAVREYVYSPDREVDPELRRHLKFLKSGSFQPPVGVFALAPILQEGGKNNPSWLALGADGKPCEALEPGGFPRYSDPSLREKCWEELEKYIAARPSLREVLILPPVSAAEYIHFADEEKYEKKVHPATYKQDIPAEFHLFLAGRTARRFPGVRLLYRGGNSLPNAKLLKRFPPALAGVPLSPGVTACAYPRAGRYWLDSAERFVRGAGGGKVVAREYWNEYDAPDLPRRGFYFTETLQRLRKEQRRYLKGFLIDLPFDPETNTLAEPVQMHLPLYVDSKLLWDPDTDVNSLEEEYCRHFFGPAAEEMRRFLRSAEKSLCRTSLRGLSPYIAPMLQRDAAELRTLLERAVNKTPPAGIYRKRIEAVLASHRWLKQDFLSGWKKDGPSLTGAVMPRETPQDGDLAKYGKWHTLVCADKSAPRTEVAFALNETRRNLFAAFRCYEPRMSELAARTCAHDDPGILGEDHVTITVATPMTGEYTFAVNSGGALLDGSTDPNVLRYTGNVLNWNDRKNFARVRRYPDRWEVELSMVRCGRAPAPGRFPWKIQIGRSRFVSGKEQKYFLAESGGPGKRCDVVFPLVDAAGRAVDERHDSVNIPIPGVPDGGRCVIPRKRAEKISFEAADWEGESWKSVPENRLGNIIDYLNRPSSPRYAPDVRFKLQYDDRRLYVFYKVREKGVRAVFREDQQNVFFDSCVELFIRPGGAKGQYYMNFEMNCVGALLLANVKIRPGRYALPRVLPEDMKKIRRHTSLKKVSGEIKEEVVWYAGLEIPWEVMEKYTSVPAPSGGAVWTGNVYKCADWSRFPHWLAWKKIGTFHQPEGFGQFIFE
ncbi:MAG: hypothetical protein IJT50_06680 [Lentisphaeria bacterium]|nr:hypothetical protein [Lentisphaeria bacterium]